MKTKLYMAPWCKIEPTEELMEATELIADNVWRDASIRFYSERDSKLRANRSAPKGMQRYINEILIERFIENGWYADAGYFVKGKTWVRITFRHQMSIGSDFIDAIKVCKKENIELAVIIAADRDTLKIITPNDAAALVSFEKIKNEVDSLNGAIDIPLVYGCITPMTSASSDVERELIKSRPRDVSVPTKI